MEATKKIRIVRVEIVRDFDKSYYANLYNENGVCHNLSKEYTDFRTLKTLCKKEYGVNLPNLSQIEFETHGRKSYAYISTETPQISTEAAETVNVSAEGENAAERANIEQNHSDTRIVEDEYRHKYKVTRHWLNGRIESIEVWDLDHTSEPPQSPETPQTVEYATDTPKPRETARKRPNRAIGSAQHHQCSALGANGYAVLNDASATMAAMNVRCDTLRDTLRSVTHVPRECSTVDAAHW